MSNIAKTEITVLEKVEQVSKDLDFQRFKLTDTTNIAVVKTSHREPTAWWFIMESIEQYTPVGATTHFDGPEGTFESELEDIINYRNSLTYEEAEIISEDVTEVQETTGEV